MAHSLDFCAEIPAVSAAQKLGEISLGLLEGHLELKLAEQALTCHPGPLLQFQVEAKETDSRGELVIHIEWPLRLVVGPRLVEPNP